jgi:hypothetical protein
MVHRFLQLVTGDYVAAGGRQVHGSLRDTSPGAGPELSTKPFRWWPRKAIPRRPARKNGFFGAAFAGPTPSKSCQFSPTYPPYPRLVLLAMTSQPPTPWAELRSLSSGLATARFHSAPTNPISDPQLTRTAPINRAAIRREHLAAAFV